MKKGMYKKSHAMMRFTAWVVIYAFLMLPSGVAFAGNPLPLGSVPIPQPPNLGDFVQNNDAAIKLGKALFWDMQAGSDGVTACASCHYQAGADGLRHQNQINPGPNARFDVVGGPNLSPLASFYPFFQPGVNNFDDVGGSQGVSLHQFKGIVEGNALDIDTSPDLSPLFGHSRQVTGANTPPAVNAIFNYANFWDGRANNTFNGNNPIGPLDVNAGIWVMVGTPAEHTLEKKAIAIENASLASQATGPPLSAVEMSWAGRTWPLLGRKMLSLTPLATQIVSSTDSVLGSFATTTTGLHTTYSQMIKDAFQPAYWSSPLRTPDGFTQMEANFSLFWGLAIQLYEATLISDDTPFDRYLAGNTTAMSDAAQRGFNKFQSKCAMCHSGSELTDASYTSAFANGLVLRGDTVAGNAVSDNGFHNLGVRPTTDNAGRGGVINFDLSFAMQAVDQSKGTLPFAAPQTLDGIAATTPVDVNGSFKTPSIRNIALTPPYMHNGSLATLDQVVEFYNRGGNFPNPELAVDLTKNGIVGFANNASDKADMVAFLNALTDPRVANETAPFDHPELRIPNGDDPETFTTLAAKGAGGTSLLSHATMTMTFAGLPKATISGAPTGVVNQKNATITVGGTGVVTYQYQLDGGAAVTLPVTTPINLTGLGDAQHTVTVIGLDAAGHAQLASIPTKATWTVKATPPVVAIDPVATNTKNTTQTISGTMDAGSTVAVHVDTGAAVGPVTVSGTTWTCKVSGLTNGDNKITVTATDAVGNPASAGTLIKVVIADGCFRGTGSPDVTDALKALRISVGIVVATADDKLHGDVNSDGNIDTGDALLILKKAAGLASF
jgi:cytochrome c peroxidase